MLSPAELVWMIRSFDPCAASIETDAVHRAIPARIVRAPRNTCVFVIVVIPLLIDKLSSRGLSGDGCVRQETDAFARRYFAFSPSTNAFNVSQSGSLCELNCCAPP